MIGPAVKADITATYGGLKRAHFVYPAKEYVGKVFLVDIGIPPKIEAESSPTCFLVEEEDAAKHFRKRPAMAHKGTFGHLAIICGSPGKTGAGIMAGESALKVGAGLVTLFVPKSLNSVYESQTLEVMSYPLEDEDGFLTSEGFDQLQGELKNKTALAIGPGLGQHPKTLELLKKIIDTAEIPMVIDADGINLSAKNPSILKNRKAP